MKGKIFVVGIGPGDHEYLTPRAKSSLNDSDIIIGYFSYIKLIKPLFPEKEYVTSGMTKEVERCKQCIDHAKDGKVVSLISSGDPGIYGMAGILLELAANSKEDICIEVVPGVTSYLAAASLLGSPITEDHVVISLSDLLIPWGIIENRIHCAGKGDFVTCIYNPKSKGRREQISKTRDILLSYRSATTPVGIVKNAMRDGQNVIITDINQMLEHEIDMSTLIIIGNSRTFVKNNFMITPRGYNL